MRRGNHEALRPALRHAEGDHGGIVAGHEIFSAGLDAVKVRQFGIARLQQPLLHVFGRQEAHGALMEEIQHFLKFVAHVVILLLGDPPVCYPY